MGKYIVRRLLQMIPVVLGSTFLIYVLVFALPGDPAEGRCGERPCNPAYIAAFNEEYNLDKPLLVQYGLYLGKLLQGDLGTTFYGNSVLHELAIRYPTTVRLALIAIVFEIVIGITAGVLAGIRRGQLRRQPDLGQLAHRHRDTGLRHRQRAAARCSGSGSRSSRSPRRTAPGESSCSLDSCSVRCRSPTSRD